MRCLFPEAKRSCGRHTRVARRGRLFVLSLHHHDEKDAAFVPAAEPADSPIIDTIAERHRLAKAKELGLNVHGHLRPHTHSWLGWRGQSRPLAANRPKPHIYRLNQLSAAPF